MSGIGKLIVGGGLLAVALGALAQRDPKEPWIDLKVIGSGKVDKVKGEGGYIGEKTDVLYYSNIEFKWEIIDGYNVTSDQDRDIYCKNICNGKKHAKHKDCDGSCDTPCDQKHHLVMKGKSKKDLKQVLNSIENFRNEAKQAKFDGKIPASKILDAAAQAFDDAVKSQTMELDLFLDHFADKPCTIGYHHFNLKKDMVMLTMTLTLASKDGSSKSVSSWQAYMGDIEVPDPNPFYNWAHVECRCEGFKEVLLRGPDKPIDMRYAQELNKEVPSTLPAKPVEPPKQGDPPKVPGVDVKPQNGKISFDNPETVEFKCEGVDMMSLRCEFINHTDQPVEFTVGAGTLFGPDRLSEQRMTTLKMIKLLVPPAKQFAGPWVEIPGVAAVDVPAACVEMHKNPPTRGTPFHVIPAFDDGIANVAERIDATGGDPSDQSAIWIVTDHATFSDVQQRTLFPKLTEGVYLNGLYEAGTAGGVDITKDGKPLASPGLIAGIDASPQATVWFIQTLDSSDPEGLASAVAYAQPNWMQELSQNPLPRLRRHVADVAAALCSSKNTKAKKAGLALLAAIPESERKAIVAMGALSGLMDAMEDHETRSSAIDLAKSFQSSQALGINAGTIGMAIEMFSAP